VFSAGGNKVDRLHLREWSFNAPIFREIGKHLYFERYMPTPAIAWLIRLLIPDAILFEKACHQIRGKLISQFLPVGKFDEVFPRCSIPIP
jgi:hypothetical protein